MAKKKGDDFKVVLSTIEMNILTFIFRKNNEATMREIIDYLDGIPEEIAIGLVKKLMYKGCLYKMNQAIDTMAESWSLSAVLVDKYRPDMRK